MSVYALRNLEDTDGVTLVEALCDAKKRGTAVAVITDKDQADGDGDFTSGDPTHMAYHITQCGIPVYKAKNYNSNYSAFHHKNAIFGLEKPVIVTDTANWSGASMSNGKHGLMYLL